MIQQSHLKEPYSFIKRNRFRRKLKMYKLAFGVMVDRTTAIYLLIIGGYVIASFFIAGDIINDFHDQFMIIENQATLRFGLILTILPIKYITQSFSKPGVIFSTSEYQLSLLPYSREKIWFLCARDNWIKTATIYSLIGFLIIIFTPLSSALVVKYIFVFLIMDIIMTIPRWKLYQLSTLKKIGWLLLMSIVNFISFATNPALIGLILIGLLVIVNIRMMPTLFRQVNWSKITEISDFQIWNMPLISKASGVKFERQKKYSFFQNLNYRKKPFAYTEKSIHSRIWSVYLGKNTGIIIQLLAALLVLLVFTAFINELVFQIAIAFSIHAYTAVAASFFSNRFGADILHVLPWNLPRYKETFSKWILFGGVILLLPVFTYLRIYATWWMPFQLLFYSSTFIFLAGIKIDKEIALLSKKYTSLNGLETIGYVLLIGIVFSGQYPIILLSSLGVILLIKHRRKHNLQ